MYSVIKRDATVVLLLFARGVTVKVIGRVQPAKETGRRAKCMYVSVRVYMRVCV